MTMKMAKNHVVQFGVFYALLLPVCGYVPSPTNISVVCHNFVNVLYWNYSNPTEQLKFSVNIKPYESVSQSVDTSQMYLDISSYSRDAGDDYFVSVTAHDGQEKSESVSIRFTYSKDFFDENKHKYKCSLDFPAVNTSVHKDVIKASFQHPFLHHQQDILKQIFMYTVTHDELKVLYSCFEDEDLCISEIHFNQSVAGQCIELKFEGKIAGIPLYTYIHVCVPQQTPETDKTGLIAALLGGGTIVLFIIMGVIRLLWRKWSTVSKITQGLQSLIPGQSPSPTLLFLPEETTISQMTSQGHRAQMRKENFNYGSPSTSQANTSLDDTVGVLPEVSEEDVNNDNSEGFVRSSDYDRPKFL
ncbi:interferon gamma receptor 1-like [Labeo rohita]|uniref:interferon gamma receptor 1-like n=1 Tax=Labeo rohita TaxID=84645 RepID=UPI0021E2EDC0|nr:interferon gamma receptor 1-like [Labeo rohita]